MSVLSFVLSFPVAIFSLATSIQMGGQSGVEVTRSHGKDQDVGSNPATARNEKTHIRQTPAQKVPQLCGRISVEDRRCKAELDL